MRVMVVGSGAREHAIVTKLRTSPLVEKLFAVPGNAGIARLAECLELATPDAELDVVLNAYADLAERHKIDLTIVGPETLLVDGLADRFHERGLRIFGPTQAAARLEGSKIWAKEVMQSVGIPTATWRPFTDVDDALAYAAELRWNCVVKADGLAAGKGAFVCAAEEQVRDVLYLLLVEKRFGDRPILIEEVLSGQEVSVFALSDGRTVVPFGAAQDHKRAHDLDEGPNTGGMGAYSPVNHMQVAEDFATSFFQPLVNRMDALGTPYVGVMYAGAIVTSEGPKILEFNCRFGDPEAEVLLTRLDADLAEILMACANGALHRLPEVKWASKSEALCVVVATDSYPLSSDFGTPIFGVEEAEKLEEVFVFHAGTQLDPDNGQLITNGGRIFCVTGVGATLEDARTRAYEAVQLIHFDGMMFRRDIGTKAIGTSWNAAWTAEWRKPPRWEITAMDVSIAIGRIATRLQELQTASVNDIGSELAGLREQLFDIKLSLFPPPHVVAEEAASHPDPLAELGRDFDKLYDRMQSDTARGGVVAILGAKPDTYLADHFHRPSRRW